MPLWFTQVSRHDVFQRMDGKDAAEGGTERKADVIAQKSRRAVLKILVPE